MKLKNPFLVIRKKERPFHLALWVAGLILINIPGWEVDLGVFHSDDYSLVIPSIYGTFLNAYLFYSCARLIIESNFSNISDAVIASLLTLLGVTLLESVLDAVFYAIYFWSFDQKTFTDIILSEVLMDFVFVYLPSMMYAFVKMWHPHDDEEEDKPLLTLRDDSKGMVVEPKDLIYVENHGNFSLYHTPKHHLLNQSLEEALEHLPDHFMQCHSSYIVNTWWVKAVLKDEVVVGGFIVPLEEKYRSALQKALPANVLVVAEAS